MAAQGGTQGSETGKEVFFPAVGESRGFRECSDPTSVIPEECGFHDSSVGTWIASQLTQIWSRIIMG